MKAYRLTDRNSILAALDRTTGRTGSCAGREITFTAIKREENINQTVLVTTNQPAGDNVIFTFGDKVLKVRLTPLENLTYSVKDVVIESMLRSSGRIDTQKIHIANVEFSPAVDLTSSIALYGKTSSISTVCQRMKMFLHDYLNRTGFMISECRIGFFFSADLPPVFQELETAGGIFFIRDVLSKSIVSGDLYTNPLLALPEARQESYYTKLSRERMRSQYVYSFRDQSGNVMGFIEFQSTMPDLGHQGLGTPAALKIFSNYLFEKSSELVFQMEMSMTRQWFSYSRSEEIIDLSQNGRGCRITLKAPSEELKKKLKKGSTLRFDIVLKGTPHKIFGTVRSVQETQDTDLIGLKVQTGSQANSLDELSLLAKSIIGAVNV